MSERPPDAVLWDFLRGAITTKALGVVADFRVPHALAGGPRHVEEVAREVGADADTLHRLLRALASDGVFVEETPGVFRNTEASGLLARDGWDDFAGLFAGVFYQTVADLDRSARTGVATFPDAFGSDFWSWLGAHAEERAAFDRAMAQGWEGRVERLAELDWRGDELVVDVGGGNGSLLIELLRRHPGLHGIVFDLPETNRDDAALGDRVEFVAGDFFDRVPAGDVYILSTILHDWGDEQAAAILRTIHRAGRSDSRLLVIDSVVPPGNEPDGAKWLDLLMLVLLGGRERDEAQWRLLLADGGFEPATIRSGLIEARWR